MNKLTFTDEEWKKVKSNGAYCPALFNSLYLSPQSHITNCCVMQEQDMGKAPTVTEEQRDIPVVDLLNQDWSTKSRRIKKMTDKEETKEEKEEREKQEQIDKEFEEKLKKLREQDPFIYD